MSLSLAHIDGPKYYDAYSTYSLSVRLVINLVNLHYHPFEKLLEGLVITYRVLAGRRESGMGALGER